MKFDIANDNNGNVVITVNKIQIRGGQLNIKTTYSDELIIGSNNDTEIFIPITCRKNNKELSND